ncbi:MAG: TIM barrel protein [Acidimicrobiales bacterium]|nr:TIM barrel protein [Acidimicrobiales bacterium]RZV48207.1 MAG: inosose dehydratase [Acidimicrobiales bacterium]
MNRLATAPISWGICEVPGWGVQLPVDRVLGEMSQLGFPATELGSEGYLPSEPFELNRLLANYDLDLLAAFVPLVVHEHTLADDTLRRADETAALLAAAGATYFNTSTVTSYDWEPRRTLTEDEWAHALSMLDRLSEVVEAHGLVHVLHEHIDTIVETKQEIQRVIDGCSVQFVLDTAHFAVGGYDPLEFADAYPDRVGLVHIKDADLSVAARLNAGECTLMEAVQQGIFPTVGAGDLPIDSVIQSLERSGFTGWYVLEQDAAITGEEPAVGQGPLLDVETSLNYLKNLEVRLAA